ncbi:MAG: flagellar basal body P-ring formation chaperone FlgA [bacterium]
MLRRVRLQLLGLVTVTLAFNVGAGSVAGERVWTMSLKEAVTLPVGEVRLAQITEPALTGTVGELVIAAGNRAGSVVEVGRQRVLRELVAAGLAAGVRCLGAETCRIQFSGRRLEAADVETWLREQLQPQQPPAVDGAPPTRLEVQVNLPDLTVTSACHWELVEPRPLRPGRNLVPVQFRDTRVTTRVTATVLCHVFGELAQARLDIERGAEITPELFTWEWRDLCHLENGLVVGRDILADKSSSRRVGAGKLLRQADLKETPLVLQGEPVELRLSRGAVTVAVRAVSRQEGRLGQIITVRNELNGKLVTARVVGPGQVEMRR